MPGSITRDPPPLPAGHPCGRCRARRRAICKVLDCDGLAEFKSLGSTLTVSAGQVLFREREAATRVFSLTRGSVKLHQRLRRGQRRIVGFLAAGDFLGVSLNGKRAFSAEMIEDGELCSFRRERFDIFIAGHPPMERQLIEDGFHELSAARLHRSILGRDTAAAKIATFLLALAKRHGAANDKPLSARLPMSQADLADYLDLGDQTITTMFSRFEVARLIRSIDSRHIDIPNPRLLEELVRSATATQPSA